MMKLNSLSSVTSSTGAVQSKGAGAGGAGERSGPPAPASPGPVGPGERSGPAAPAKPRVEEAEQAVVGRGSGRGGLPESEDLCSNELRSGDSCEGEGGPGGLETKRPTRHSDQLQRAEHLRRESPVYNPTGENCPLCKGNPSLVEYYNSMFFRIEVLPDHDGSPSADERSSVKTASCSVASRRVRKFFKRVIRGIAGKRFCC